MSNDNFNDPISYIKDELLEINAIQMNENTINLILTYFNDFKYNLLMNGYSVKEKNIGILIPTLRFKSENRKVDNRGVIYPLVKLNARIDLELKKALTQRIINSEEVRKRVRPQADDITEKDINYLKNKYLPDITSKLTKSYNNPKYDK